MFPRFQDELLVEIFWWGRPQASHFPIHKKPWVSGGFVWVSIWAVDGINWLIIHDDTAIEARNLLVFHSRTCATWCCFLSLGKTFQNVRVFKQQFLHVHVTCLGRAGGAGARAEVNRCGLPRTWWPTWAPRMPCARSPTWASAWSTPLLTTARRSSRPALRRPWHSNLGSSNKTEAHQVKESGSSNSRARTIVTWRV